MQDIDTFRLYACAALAGGSTPDDANSKATAMLAIEASKAADDSRQHIIRSLTDLGASVRNMVEQELRYRVVGVKREDPSFFKATLGVANVSAMSLRDPESGDINEWLAKYGYPKTDIPQERWWHLQVSLDLTGIAEGSDSEEVEEAFAAGLNSGDRDTLFVAPLADTPLRQFICRVAQPDQKEADAAIAAASAGIKDA